MPRRKVIALNAFIRKIEEFQINDHSGINDQFPFKKSEKEQIYPNHAEDGNHKGNSRNG